MKIFYMICKTLCMADLMIVKCASDCCNRWIWVIDDLRRIKYEPSTDDLKKIAQLLVQRNDILTNKHALMMSDRYKPLGELISLYTADEGFNLNVFTSLSDALNFMSDCIGRWDHTQFLNNGPL